MKELILEQKINALNKFSTLNKKDVDRFGEIIKSLDNWSLFRINPLKFAREYNFDIQSLTDIFVHAAKIGFFDFSWNLICPICGGIEYSDKSLNMFSSDKDFECITCNKSIEVELDSQLEVSFTINEIIKELDVYPSSDMQNYRKYFFSSNFLLANEVVQFFSSLLHGIYTVNPDEPHIISFTPEKNSTYKLLNLQTHSQCIFNITEQESELPQIVEIDLLSKGFATEIFSLPPGKINIYLHNRTKYDKIVSFYKLDSENFYKIYSKYPNQVEPFMTGKMLLNNQSFRELFKVQSLSPDLKLSVKSLTIMFTDLKGSTEMYDKVGDYKAYNLVQKHFEILIDSVRKYSGAIVKTMGDAIMATFSNPLDAFLAANDMLNEVNNFNKDSSEKIGLKIGLNEGNALAVNSDARLDYFGQSINIAARVQGLAQENEIWITERVYDSAQLKDYLENLDYLSEKQSALLKGVGSPVIVYKCLQKY